MKDLQEEVNNHFIWPISHLRMTSTGNWPDKAHLDQHHIVSIDLAIAFNPGRVHTRGSSWSSLRPGTRLAKDLHRLRLRVMPLLRLTATWFGLITLACGGNTGSDPVNTAAGRQTAGHTGSGSTVTGGTTTGGTGGATTGGVTAGRTSTRGGNTSGGADTGRIATGGASSGGASAGDAGSGATSTGGTDTGGSTAGGAITSGAGPGGANAGGAGAGGFDTGGTSGSGDANTGGTSGSGGTNLGCYVGVRVDDCCSEPIALDEVEFNDPCLLPYKRDYTAEDLAHCPEAKTCLTVDCLHPSPPSRLTSRRNGECVFVHECIMAAAPFDYCWVATDFNFCCSCPEVLPRFVVETDPCVLTEGTPEPGTCADCSDVRCASCDTPLPTVLCDYNSDAQLMVCRP